MLEERRAEVSFLTSITSALVCKPARRSARRLCPRPKAQCRAHYLTRYRVAIKLSDRVNDGRTNSLQKADCSRWLALWLVLLAGGGRKFGVKIYWGKFAARKVLEKFPENIYF